MTSSEQSVRVSPTLSAEAALKLAEQLPASASGVAKRLVRLIQRAESGGECVEAKQRMNVLKAKLVFK